MRTAGTPTPPPPATVQTTPPAPAGGAGSSPASHRAGIPERSPPPALLARIRSAPPSKLAYAIRRLLSARFAAPCIPIPTGVNDTLNTHGALPTARRRILDQPAHRRRRGRYAPVGRARLRSCQRRAAGLGFPAAS